MRNQQERMCSIVDLMPKTRLLDKIDLTWNPEETEVIKEPWICEEKRREKEEDKRKKKDKKDKEEKDEKELDGTEKSAC
jgi:hypothetical protein